MRFPKLGSLNLELTMKKNKKIRRRNRVRTFMRLPFLVARWAGVYLPLPTNSVCIYSTRVGVSLLLYFLVTALRTMRKTIAFSDIVYLIGDFSRAVLQPFFLLETIRKGKYLTAALWKLDDVEQDLSALGKPPFRNARVLRALAIRLLLTCGTMIGGLARQCKFRRLSVTFMIQYTFMNAIMFYFYATWFVLIAFLNMVEQQFAFLRRRLEVISMPAKNSGQKRVWEEHGDLVKHHFRVCSAVDDLCRWFELSFLFYAGVYFFISTFGFYTMTLGVVTFYRNPNWCRGADLTTNMLWVVLRTDELWLVLRFCSLAERSSLEFSDRLHQVMIAADKYAEGIFKLHFAMKPKVELWACGFFRIDNTLAYSMIGAAATYLAVVYQAIDLESDNFTIRPKSNSTI